jgi:hypothetical protein
MKNDQAQIMALQVIGYLLSDEDLAQQFFATSGATPEHLKADLANSDTLLAALDFLLQNDQTLLSFCDMAEFRPEQVWRAYHALNGTPL